MKTHRWVGLVAAIFLVLLTITGIVLQHPTTFGLNQRFVQSETVLSWYGIELGQVETSYRLGNSYLVLTDGEVYWQTPNLTKNLVRVESLTGAALENNLLIFTDAFYYYLFDAKTAEPVEHAKAPANIQGSGVVDGRLVFRSEDSWFQFTVTTTDFIEIAAQDAELLIKPSLIPMVVEQQISRDKSSHIISWQQLLTDLHTGRLFGGLGTALIDLAALAILILAVTGLWNWSARRRV